MTSSCYEFWIAHFSAAPGPMGGTLDGILCRLRNALGRILDLEEHADAPIIARARAACQRAIANVAMQRKTNGSLRSAAPSNLHVPFEMRGRRHDVQRHKGKRGRVRD